MRRKLLAFSMTLALLLSLSSIAGVGAHTVFIEGTGTTDPPSRGDWFGVQTDQFGEGIVQRNNAQQGEYIFNDATGDQRLIVSATKGITRAADLDWFGVTADQNNIYFIAKPDFYTGVGQNPALEVMISIDTDHVSSSDPTKIALPNNAGISVANEAAWEYVVDAAFTKCTGVCNGVALTAPKIYTHVNAIDPITTSTCGTGVCAAQLVSGKSFAEISVPWSKIGGKPLGANYLRFSVATFYNPRTQPPTGSQTTAVIDFLNSGNTRTATENDIADGQLGSDTAFDVHFDTNTATPSYEPYAPLVITEFQANPVGKDDPATASSTDSEWIEVYNPNSFAITNLNEYKIGNAAKRDPAGSQGMFRFKATTIPPKGVVIVARSRAKFLSARPGYSGTVYDLGADMVKYSTWSNGTTIDLANGPSGTATTFEEQIVLLDEKDSIVDMVTYGNKIPHYPGVIPIFTNAVPEGTSVSDSVSWERCPASVDTNGGFINSLNEPPANTDFVIHNSAANKQTPGAVCDGRPGVDMQINKSGPSTTAPNGKVAFTLTYANIGDNDELPNTKVTITDTLPLGLSFTNIAANASQAPFSVTPDGKTIVWKVNAPAHGGQPSTIVLTTTVDPGVAPNTTLTNLAKISSPNEPKDAQTQLNNQSQWPVTTNGPAQLAIALNNVTNTPPGRPFSFIISYSNQGQTDAGDTQITLNVPAGVTLTSISAPGATANFNTPINGPTSITWSVSPALLSGQQGLITVNGQVAGNVSGGTQLQFTASIQSADAVPTTVNVTKSITAQLAKIFLPMVRK